MSIEQIDQRLAKRLPMVNKEETPASYRMDADQLARVIDYGVKLVGEDHIGLGSDLDGGPLFGIEALQIGGFTHSCVVCSRCRPRCLLLRQIAEVKAVISTCQES